MCGEVMSEEESKLGNRGMLLNMAVEAMGSPGIVVDADVAVRTPCRCYTYEGEPKICYSRGIIGSMSRAQIEAYCKPLIKLDEAKRIKEWMAATKEAKAAIAGIPRGERLEPWLKAMAASLSRRGIEL